MFYSNENLCKSELSPRKNVFLGIDHVLVCVNKGLEAIQILQEFGLDSPGEIVKNKSLDISAKIFFFNNIYLVVIWLGDQYSSSNAVINFSGRCNSKYSLISPFGIGISRSQRKNLQSNINKNLLEDLVIGNYIYYFEENQNNILEPFIFIIPDYLSYNSILNQSLLKKYKYTNDCWNIKQVTNLKIIVKKGRRRNSQILNWLKNKELLNISRGAQPLLELTFDYGVNQKIFDARPILPIILSY